MKYDSWKIENPEPKSGDIPGLTPLLSALLNARNISSAEDVHGLLYPDEELLHDPFLMKDMDKAVARIKQAIENGEQTAVYGDYDVDGITSGCLLTSFLRRRGLECQLYIPDRISEGYGLNKAAIKSIHDSGATLIVTVDCGITAVEEALYAESLGVCLVITDHHECREELPKAAAVVDPKRPDCGYPDSSLAGVGVAFKLVCALSGDTRAMLEEYSDLAALGTVADVMPLLGENRYITKRGLEKLRDNPAVGLLALLEETNSAGKEISSATIGFTIAPRVNAAGRLGDVQIAAELLLTDSELRAQALAMELCALNRERQELETKIWQEALLMLGDSKPRGPIVLASENWHQGVVGIVASRLTESYGVPAVMISMTGDKGKGSCRSYGNFNLFEALSSCTECIDSFGGHALAAGLNIYAWQIDDFRTALGRYYDEHPPERGTELLLDLCADRPELLTMESTASLSWMEPFGRGNPKPRLCIMDGEVESVVPLTGGKHLKLSILKFGERYECVLFGRGPDDIAPVQGDRADVAFYPQINEFRGRRTVQLNIIDIRMADYSELCRNIINGENTKPEQVREYMPRRRNFVCVWRSLASRGGRLSGSTDSILSELEPDKRAHPTVCICIMVFNELGLLDIERLSGGDMLIRQLESEAKVDLMASKLLNSLSDSQVTAD